MKTTKFTGYFAFCFGHLAIFVTAATLSHATSAPFMAAAILIMATVLLQMIFARLDALPYDIPFALAWMCIPPFLNNSVGIMWITSDNLSTGLLIFVIGFSIICVISCLLEIFKI